MQTLPSAIAVAFRMFLIYEELRRGGGRHRGTDGETLLEQLSCFLFPREKTGKGLFVRD